MSVVAIVGLWPARRAKCRGSRRRFTSSSPGESKFIALDAGLSPAAEIPFAVPEGCGNGRRTRGAARTGAGDRAELRFWPCCAPPRHTTALVEQPITDSDSHFLAWGSSGRGPVSEGQQCQPSAGCGNGIWTGTRRSSRSRNSPTTLRRYRTRTHSCTVTRPEWHGQRDATDPWARRSRRTDRCGRAQLPFPGALVTGWTAHCFHQDPGFRHALTVGELWVMDADGSGARRLAERRMPDMVRRPRGRPMGRHCLRSPRERRGCAGGRLADRLDRNLYVVNADTGALTQVTHSRIHAFKILPGCPAATRSRSPL